MSNLVSIYSGTLRKHEKKCQKKLRAKAIQFPEGKKKMKKKKKERKKKRK